MQGSTSLTNVQQKAPQADLSITFDKYSLCVEALLDGRVQAVTTDNVILLGFVNDNKGKVKLVGNPFTTEPYGIGLKKGDTAFRNWVNDQLRALRRQRLLRRGVERHGRRDRPAGRPRRRAPDRYVELTRAEQPLSVVWDNLDLLWAGWRTTLYLTTLSFLGALAIGLVLASCRVSPVRPAAGRGVHLRRDRPQHARSPSHLVLLFFGLPKLGITWSPMVTAVVGLAVYTGSFAGEVIRAGINTVGWGQVEAARAVGLGFGQVLRLVVMPQALRASIGPLGSVLSALVRNTAVAYTISVLDIMGQADRLVTETAQAMPVLARRGAVLLLADAAPRRRHQRPRAPPEDRPMSGGRRSRDLVLGDELGPRGPADGSRSPRPWRRWSLARACGPRRCGASAEKGQLDGEQVGVRHRSGAVALPAAGAAHHAERLAWWRWRSRWCSGAAGAVGRLHRRRAVRVVAITLVELLRATPLVLLIYFMGQFLPRYGARPRLVLVPRRRPRRLQRLGHRRDLPGRHPVAGPPASGRQALPSASARGRCSG